MRTRVARRSFREALLALGTLSLLLTLPSRADAASVIAGAGVFDNSVGAVNAQMTDPVSATVTALGTGQTLGLASVDLASGRLRSVSLTDADSEVVSSVARIQSETIHIDGPLSEPTAIAFFIAVDGMLSGTNNAYGDYAYFEITARNALGTFVSGEQWIDKVNNTRCVQPFRDLGTCFLGINSVDRVITISAMVDDAHRDIYLSASLQTHSFGGDVDFGSTASFSLQLPAGLTFTSGRCPARC
jgi:hypothetical protein